MALFNVIVICSLIAISAIVVDCQEVEDEVYEETTDLKFLYQCLDQHNVHRKQLGNRNLLYYNRETEIQSRRRAMKMALSSKILSSDKQLENVHWTSANSSMTCRDIVDVWFADYQGLNRVVTDESRTKKLSDGEMKSIWESSAFLGCAQIVKVKPEGGVFTVCSYGQGEPVVLNEELTNYKFHIGKKVIKKKL